MPHLCDIIRTKFLTANGAYCLATNIIQTEFLNYMPPQSYYNADNSIDCDFLFLMAENYLYDYLLAAGYYATPQPVCVE